MVRMLDTIVQIGSQKSNLIMTLIYKVERKKENEIKIQVKRKIKQEKMLKRR